MLTCLLYHTKWDPWNHKTWFSSAAFAAKSSLSGLCVGPETRYPSASGAVGGTQSPACFDQSSTPSVWPPYTDFKKHPCSWRTCSSCQPEGMQRITRPLPPTGRIIPLTIFYPHMQFLFEVQVWGDVSVFGKKKKKTWNHQRCWWFLQRPFKVCTFEPLRSCQLTAGTAVKTTAGTELTGWHYFFHCPFLFMGAKCCSFVAASNLPTQSVSERF